MKSSILKKQGTGWGRNAPFGTYFFEIAGEAYKLSQDLNKNSLFTKQQLIQLIWPLLLEQFLSMTMGVADTYMVSSVGEAAETCEEKCSAAVQCTFDQYSDGYDRGCTGQQEHTPVYIRAD